MRASAVCVARGEFVSSVRHAWQARLVAERADEFDEAARIAALRAFLLSGLALYPLIFALHLFLQLPL